MKKSGAVSRNAGISDLNNNDRNTSPKNRAQRTNSMWSKWWPWSLGTGVGYAVALLPGVPYLFIVYFVADTAEEITLLSSEALWIVAFSMFYGAVFGFIVGTVQRIAISEGTYPQMGRNWFFLSVLSSAFGFSFLMILPIMANTTWYVSGLIIGALVGLAQWIELRIHFEKAIVWVPASAICGFLLVYGGQVLFSNLDLVPGILSVLLAAVLSGTVMTWLLLQPKQTETLPIWS